jgi:hypothetical protein
MCFSRRWRVDLVDEVGFEQPADQGTAAVHLQLTRGLAFNSPMAAARSPQRRVVFAQRGSVSVVDARYPCGLAGFADGEDLCAGVGGPAERDVSEADLEALDDAVNDSALDRS